MSGFPPGFVFSAGPRDGGSPFSYYEHEPPSSREYLPDSYSRGDYSRDYAPRPNEQAKEQREYEQRLRELGMWHQRIRSTYPLT